MLSIYLSIFLFHHTQECKIWDCVWPSQVEVCSLQSESDSLSSMGKFHIFIEQLAHVSEETIILFAS